LGAGLLKDFDKILNDALLSSGSIFGDNSIHYASTLVDVAAIYNDYGNYRISREYVDRARDLLTKTNQLTEPLKARIGLVEAEAMTGQGFSNAAVVLLRSMEHTLPVERLKRKPLSMEALSRRNAFLLKN
jgi:hypothetical protein